MNPMEHDEALAMGLIANGIGSRPLRENRRYSEAVVSFTLGTLDEVRVFLRRNRKTRRQFRFRIMPVGADASPVVSESGEEAPRDVRPAMAERFLCDTLEIIRELPGSLQRSILGRALDHLVASGRLDEEGILLLRAFVRAWPAAAAGQRKDAKAQRREGRMGDAESG